MAKQATYSTRFTEEEAKLVDTAAQNLLMSTAQFMREAVLQVAKEYQKYTHPMKKKD